MASNDEERNLERQKLGEAEKVDLELRRRGVRVMTLADFNERDVRTIDEIIKVAAIARQTSRTMISVKVIDEHGNPTQMTDRVGHEDVIFMQLLMSRLSQQAQSGGSQA
jgi:hypothetical protein